MALLSKNELQYNYSWKEYNNEDPKVSGELDNTIFNRSEGYEMLYLLNKIAAMQNITNKTICLRMEIMIIDSLPGEICSQIDVRNWIRDNWNK